MPTFNGNSTVSTAISTAYPSPTRLVSFSLANKTGGAGTMTVGIFYGSTITHLFFGKALAANDTYVYNGEPILVPANYQIYVNCSVSTDYYFTITNNN
jgi:hypothetical protein